MNLLPACRAGSRDELMLRAERSYARALALGGLRLEAILRYAIEQLVDHNNAGPILTFAELKTIPATIEDFVENPDFLGGIVAVWPHLLGDLKALNPDVLAGEEPVHEAFLGGATGIGKSTVARISILYQVYLLSCLQNPHRLYGLDPKTRFVIPLQSAWRPASGRAPSPESAFSIRSTCSAACRTHTASTAWTQRRAS